jgi:hypothetical protein
MMDFGQMFQEQILPQLVLLGGTLILAGLAYAKTAIGKWIKNKADNEAVRGAMEWVNELVFDEVSAASQTAIRELKKALSDGKVTKEEYEAGKKKIKEEVLQRLSDKTIGRLLGSGAADTTAKAVEMLDKKIESVIPRTKTIQNAAKPKAEDP